VQQLCRTGPIRSLSFWVDEKGKVEDYTRTGHEGPEGE
jgi:hypothetical protein